MQQPVERSKRFRASVFSCFLVFSLLISQAISLNHSHEGDFNDRADCEICLKVNSTDDVNLSETTFAVLQTVSDTINYETILGSGVSLTSASARAPPLA